MCLTWSEWMSAPSISSLALTPVFPSLTSAVSGKRYVLMSMQFMRFMAVYGWERVRVSWTQGRPQNGEERPQLVQVSIILLRPPFSLWQLAIGRLWGSEVCPVITWSLGAFSHLYLLRIHCKEDSIKSDHWFFVWVGLSEPLSSSAGQMEWK